MPPKIGNLSSCEDEPTAKRRKVRRGTQSCWECKRRKVRCIFALPTNATCDNCVRRKAACISQEYSDDPDLHNKKLTDETTENRLSRVEVLLEQLVKNVGTPYDYSARGLLKNRSESVVMKELEHTSQTESAAKNQPGNCIETHLLPSSAAVLTSRSVLQPPDMSLVSKYTGLARDLVASWPTQHDLERIYELPIYFSTHWHTGICTDVSTITSQEPVSTRTILQLPPPGSHPVLIARKLLLLGSLLQGALSASQILGKMRDHFAETMSRIVNTAAKLVTTNDDLTASVEGVECIIMEAMIRSYAGNLHQAWMILRRASAVAQMIGLHRGSKISSPRILNSATRARFDLDQLCFRIVNFDRYLSVTLGLPQSSLETRALKPEAIARCQPLDRMARLQCIIAGRILTRENEELPREELKDIHEIDRLLQIAATEMPSQWWLIPDFKSNTDNAPDPSFELARITHQVSHYHLLMRLHLPWMLRSSKDGRYDHSKITAVNASREILSRYVAFRPWNPAHFYCRGFDYHAFIALTVLCLAHIDSRTPTETSMENAQSNTKVWRILAHSHPSDRGMMERTLNILARMENDEIASKLTRIMQHLLDVEADAANGADYSAVTTKSNHGATECDGEFIDGKNTLQLHIPYFGAINLQRRLISKPTGEATQPRRHGSIVVETNTKLPDQVMGQSQRPILEWDNQWSHLPDPSWGNSDLYSNDARLPQMFDSTNNLGDPDDWTVQSINEALFNSLFSGADDQDAVHGAWPLSNH